MAKGRRPVSGMAVILQQPTGTEDILPLEAPAYDTSFVLELVARLALPSSGGAVEWSTLCLTDLDALLLQLRQMLFGDLIRTDIVCPAEGCGKRNDLAFRIGEYLVHHRPRSARGVEPADEAGWFRFRDAPVSFHLPSGADQIAVSGASRPEQELIRRCIRPGDIPARVLKRVETAMEALAPSLSDTLQGQCPECGMTVDVY